MAINDSQDSLLGLLLSPFSGTGEVARGPEETSISLLGPRALSTPVPMKYRLGQETAPSPVSLLTPEMISTQAPDGFDYVSPDPSGFVEDLPQPITQAEDVNARRGILSRLTGGLLGAGRDIGRAVSEPLAAGIGDIGDVYRFYQKARMQQPIASFDPSVFRGISPLGISMSLPELRLKEMEQKTKREQEDAKRKYAAVIADPNSTREEQESAYKKAFPFERESLAELKAKAVRDVIEAERLGKPYSSLPKTTRELYESVKSSSSQDMTMALAIARGELPEQEQPRDTRVLGTPAQQQAREELERRRRQREGR